MRYVVGYTPNERGADAVALATALARAQGAQLDLVFVVDKGLHVAQDVASGHVLANEKSVIGDIRGRGAMLAIELVQAGSKEPNPELTKAVAAACLM